MEVEPYQVCRSSEGWVPTSVQSSSSNIVYKVLVCPWGVVTGNICECPGYTFRGTCKHQELAADQVCGWTEFSVVKQDDEQRDNMICPHCKGPTSIRWKTK